MSDYLNTDAHRAHLENRAREKRIAAEARHRDRRERIATACMAGMLGDSERGGCFEDFAEDAVNCADALIAELDKGVQP